MRSSSRPNVDQFARDAIEDRGLFDLSVGVVHGSNENDLKSKEEVSR